MICIYLSEKVKIKRIIKNVTGWLSLSNQEKIDACSLQFQKDYFLYEHILLISVFCISLISTNTITCILGAFILVEEFVA